MRRGSKRGMGPIPDSDVHDVPFYFFPVRSLIHVSLAWPDQGKLSGKLAPEFDRLANRQRRSEPWQQNIYARLSNCHAGIDDQGPAERAAAERSQQLLRAPRAGAGRYGGRPRQSQHRNHQLSRL